MKIYQYHDMNRRGMIERIEYTTVDFEGKRMKKYANVYLPFEYNKADIGKCYDILYVMHGGGGSPDAWLDYCLIKNMLDYMIDSGEVAPLIVVFPSYYKVPRVGKPVTDWEKEQAAFFQKELVEDLLPAVEGVYNTYAEHVTEDEFRRSRMHRGFAGFSMGAANTWFTFVHNLDKFAWFVPLSGDCWEVRPQGGEKYSKQTVETICNSVMQSGYGLGEYFIYTATGTEDRAFEALDAQVKEMKKCSDIFLFSEDYSKGNFHYLLKEGWKHEYTAVVQYLYNFLPYLFAARSE